MTATMAESVRTVGEWFAIRTPVPPPRLRERMELALGDSAGKPVGDTSPACLDAALTLLERVATADVGGRDDAVDLLAADALVTYALEFLADDPERFHEEATRAMRRFGQLVESAS
jgi:hypothetical protein